jgi:hypothetical protein
MARRRIRRLIVWRYMCCSYSNLESVRTNCSLEMCGNFLEVQWKSVHCKPVLGKIRNLYFLIPNISLEERRHEQHTKTRGNSSLLGLRSQ